MSSNTPTYNVIRYELHSRAREELTRLAGDLAGRGRKRWPTKPPLLTIRCPVGHSTAKVYSTPSGPLFVSWAMVAVDAQSNREGLQITNMRGGEQELADLLDVDPDGPHPQLFGWCRCGQMRPVDRAQLREVVKAIRVGERTKRDLIL